MIVFLAVFGCIFVAGVLVFLRAYGDRKRAIDRLRGMADDTAPSSEVKPGLMESMRTFLPKLAAELFPDRRSQLAPLKKQMLQAGFYHPHALGIFLGAKLVLMLALPLMAAAIPYLMGVVS